MTHQSVVKQSPAKILTKTQMSGKYLDTNFTKIMLQVHLTTLPFLTCMDVNENNKLCPYVALVNHNFLNESKTLSIAHTMMGYFLSWWQKEGITNGKYGHRRLCNCWFWQQGETIVIFVSRYFFSLFLTNCIILYRMLSTTLTETGFLWTDWTLSVKQILYQ